MAVAHMRDEWDRFSSLMSFIAARMPFNPEKIDPVKLNPFRRNAKLRMSAELAARSDEYGWKLLEAGLKNMTR